MHNPWLALDVSTSPGARAREVRSAREQFLEDPHAGVGVRGPIVDSWRRSAAVGLDPGGWTAPPELDEQQAQERFADHPLGRLAPILDHSLSALSGEAEHLVVVSDTEGLLLSVEGDPRVQERAAENMGFAAGARWSEQAVGTNAIGIALATNHAVQVFAAEHYSERMQWWTCTAAPIRDPRSGRVVGTINLTAPMETVHPHSLALVMATGLTLETHLQSAHNERAGRLGARGSSADSVAVAHDGGEMLLDAGIDLARRDGAGGPVRPVLMLEALGRDRADVRVQGRRLALSQRHSEILVLLAAHPSGMTGEQLAIALYGDEGKPVTARAEISRLRRLLGPCIKTEPYRLKAAIRSDTGTVRQFLSEGEVGKAVALHRGPVLPRSEAPGVIDLRNELEGWTRRAVMASEDLEALWTWLNTASGEDDMQAWKRFLSSVPPEDGRRGLAAARLERLRSLFGLPTGASASPVGAAR
jgi:hypothetical protein